jgi:ubiquitin conjugation factor E4 B
MSEMAKTGVEEKYRCRAWRMVVKGKGGRLRIPRVLVGSRLCLPLTALHLRRLCSERCIHDARVSLGNAHLFSSSLQSCASRRAMANLIIDDLTGLLDELFSKLAQIHALEADIAASSWSTRPQAERVEREKTLHDLEQSASGYCERGMKTTALLRLSTTEPAPGAQFVTPELAPRLAAVLNYSLDALVGPRCVDLRVADNEKYRWDPRALLKEILRIFLNLADKNAFVRAVAEDHRSNRRELFARAADISRRRGIGLGEDELARLGKFADEVEAMKLVIDADVDMG